MALPSPQPILAYKGVGNYFSMSFPLLTPPHNGRMHWGSKVLSSPMQMWSGCSMSIHVFILSFRRNGNSPQNLMGSSSSTTFGLFLLLHQHHQPGPEVQEDVYTILELWGHTDVNTPCFPSSNMFFLLVIDINN